MTSFQTATYTSLLNGNSMVNTSAMRSVGCVHVLIGLVTVSIGVVSGALVVYLGGLCVGVWTGISFLICGTLSIIAGKSANILTVLLMACTNVLTLNFAVTGAVITLSSLFPGKGFYGVQGDHSDGIVHNQTTGTALGIVHLVVSLIEIVVCITGIRIAWRLLSSSVNAESYRERSMSYDDPYLSSSSFSVTPYLDTRRRTTESSTPPPTYDAATHTLSTSPKTVNDGAPRSARYGSLSDT